MSRETEFVHDVERFIDRHRLLAAKQHVVLAISGGVDSMVMLDVLLRLRRRRAWQLDVVHVNHQLRGEESDADEQFVRQACRERRVTVHVGHVDVRAHAAAERKSTQLAARDLRYAFFEEVRRSVGANAVATAHHADDSAETVLLNILRGTGLRGLAGIPPRRKTGQIVRPLLGVNRAGIEAYAETRGIAFRTDQSNFSTSYARNDLRLRIIPALQRDEHPDIIASLLSVSRVMTQIVRRLDRMTAAVRSNVVGRTSAGAPVLRLNSMRELDPLVREHLLLDVFRELGIDPSEDRIEAIALLGSQQVGRVVELPGGWEARRERGQIEISAVEAAREEFDQLLHSGEVHQSKEFTLTVGEPGPVPAAFSADPCEAYVDADLVRSGLRVRNWRDGDWFIPLGLPHRKKLSDLFVERKVPLREKRRIPILESEGKIVWVCGLRLDDRFKLTSKSTRAMKITYRTMEQPLP